MIQLQNFVEMKCYGEQKEQREAGTCCFSFFMQFLYSKWAHAGSEIWLRDLAQSHPSEFKRVQSEFKVSQNKFNRNECGKKRHYGFNNILTTVLGSLKWIWKREEKRRKENKSKAKMFVLWSYCTRILFLVWPQCYCVEWRPPPECQLALGWRVHGITETIDLMKKNVHSLHVSTNSTLDFIWFFSFLSFHQMQIDLLIFRFCQISYICRTFYCNSVWTMCTLLL